MLDTINRVVLEGTLEPPVVRTHDTGLLSARAYLTCGGERPFAVLIWAIAGEAAQIADLPSGSRLRVLGSLSWDREAHRLTVFVDRLRVITRATGITAERTSIRGAIADQLSSSAARAPTEP